MNSNGDVSTIYQGDGYPTYPSQAFNSETNTGTYLENPGPSSGFSFSKRGTKRMRIDDSGTTFYGSVNIPSGVISNPLLIADGSASAPSLAFSSQPTTGFHRVQSGTTSAIHIGISGVDKLKISSTVINPEVPIFSTSSITATDISAGTNSMTASTFNLGSNFQMNLSAPGTHSGYSFTTGSSSSTISESLDGNLMRTVTRNNTSGARSTSILGTTNIEPGGSQSVGILNTDYCRVSNTQGDTDPTLSFKSATTSGLSYGVSPNHISAVVDGKKVTDFNVTSGTPSITMYGNLNTGTNSITAGSVISGSINTGTNSITTSTLTADDIKTQTIEIGSTDSGLNFGGVSPGHGFLELKVNGLLVQDWDVISGTAPYVATDVYGPIFGADGSASAPQYNFLNSGNSGMYHSTSNSSLGFSINGSHKLGLTSTVVSTQVPITTGSNSLNCGDLTCSSIISTGTISCGTNSITCGSVISSGPMTSSSGYSNIAAIKLSDGTTSLPSLAFSSGTTSGLSFAPSGSTGTLITSINGSDKMDVGLSQINAYTPVSTGTNSLTTGAITCTSLTSSGSMSCGTNSFAAGAISCSSIASTGEITYPRYSAFLTTTTTQSIGTGVTAVSLATVVSSQNWTITPAVTSITIPKAGIYVFSYQFSYASNAVGSRFIYLYINGSVIAGLLQVPAVTGDSTRMATSCTRRMALNDTVSLYAYQTSGGSLNIGGDILDDTYLSAVRICE